MGIVAFAMWLSLRAYAESNCAWHTAGHDDVVVTECVSPIPGEVVIVGDPPETPLCLVRGGCINYVPAMTLKKGIIAESKPLVVPAVDLEIPPGERTACGPAPCDWKTGVCLSICVPPEKTKIGCADKTRILEHDQQDPPKYWCRAAIQ